MWYQKNLFKYSVLTLVFLTIIFVAYNIAFLLNPVLEFITILFLPVLIAGIFYYLLRPLVRLLEKQNLSKIISIIIAYVCAFSVMALIGVFAVPFLIEQISILTEPPKLEAMQKTTTSLMNIPYLEDFIHSSLYKINNWISSNILITITTITRFTVLIFITPFILFYFLKDDHELYAYFIRNLPVDYQEEAKKVLSDVDAIISKFVTGQILLALIMGTLLFVGYLLIGLDHALILAMFATIFFTIPILGSFIAIIPALLVAFATGTAMAIKVALVMLAVLALESNFISPQIMSQRLNIHPLILILVLLASGALYGILGLFLATPILAIAKVLYTDVASIYDSHTQNP